MTVNSSTIRLAELINDNAALTPNEGDIVFDAIDKSLNQGEQVHVDFKGIEFLTTAFLTIFTAKISPVFLCLAILTTPNRPLPIYRPI